jgi:hypothetical protein
MKKNKPTCSPWLHARPGEQFGLSPRSSGRVGGLSAGAQRTRRSSKGARLSGRGNRKPSSAPSCHLESGAGQMIGFSPCRYPATSGDRSATAVEIKRHHYPNYPLYRHSSCALAYVLSQPDQTGTVYRQDICPPSHCPATQRAICEHARRIPTDLEITDALRVLGRNVGFRRHEDRIILTGEVTQEEFAFLLHSFRCPLEVEAIKMQNLYHGSIYKGQRKLG